MNFWNNASTGVKILIIAVVVAAIIGVFYLLTGGFGAQPEPTPTAVAPKPATPAPTNTPVPTPKPSEPPVAVISGPTQGLVGQSITLSAADSRAAEGKEIVSYAWNLGDGTLSTNKEVTHVYQKAGRYEVTLTVIDNEGLENSSSIKVTIEEPTPTPTAEPTATPEPEPSPTPIDPVDALEGREWALLNTLPDTAIDVMFLDGKLTGFAGCNDFSGTYRAASDGSMRIDDLQSVGRMCEQPIMDQEQRFLTTLAEVTSFQIQGSQGKQLTLSTPDGLLLQFRTED